MTVFYGILLPFLGNGIGCRVRILFEKITWFAGAASVDRLCPKGVAGRQRDMACRYDEMSLSRHLRGIRMSRAVPLLLRQRRHQLRRSASEADLGEKHDVGARK